jgi:DNA-binding response OmpR family regulator
MIVCGFDMRNKVNLFKPGVIGYAKDCNRVGRRIHVFVGKVETMIRILVVDDDLAIREMLHIMLTYTGYDVLEVPDGTKALEIIHTSPEPLVVLLDLRMPTQSGLDVLYSVERDAELAGRHGFILFSAGREIETLSSEPIVHRLDIPLIAKPFDMHTLLDTIETVFRRLTKVPDRPVTMHSAACC